MERSLSKPSRRRSIPGDGAELIFPSARDHGACSSLSVEAILERPPGLAFANDLKEALELAAKGSVGLAGTPQLRHLLDVQRVVVAHLRRSSCFRCRCVVGRVDR